MNPELTHLLYLTNSASDIAAYKRANLPPFPPGTEATLTGAGAAAAGEVLIGAFASDALGLKQLDAGTYTFKLFASVSDSAGITQIKAYVFRRSAAGVETALFNVLSGEINALAVAPITFTYSAILVTGLAATDRLVIKLYHTTDNVASVTTTVYLEGSANQSRVLTPYDMPMANADMLKVIYDPDGDGIIASRGATLTVGAGKQYTTIQAAVDYIMQRGAIYPVTINIDPGTYNENVEMDWDGMGIQRVTINGDLRALAGCSWISGGGGFNVPITRASAGTGNGTLSNVGNTITVAGSTGNPNIQADGWGTGDQVYVKDNTGVWTLLTIASVATNVITFTVAAPAVGNLGTVLTLLPNRKITSTGTGPKFGTAATVDIRGSTNFYGFWVDRPTNAGSCINVAGPTTLIYKCATTGGATGVAILGSVVAATVFYTTVTPGPSGLATGTGIDYRYAKWSTSRYNQIVGWQIGMYVARSAGYFDCFASAVVSCTTGLYAQYGSFIQAGGAILVLCGTGTIAEFGSYIVTDSITNVNNTADYSPTRLNTFGSFGSYIKSNLYSSGDNEAGTAFPGTPQTGQRFFRTDLGLECYWNGTYWLTVHEYNYTLISGLPASATVSGYPMPIRGDWQFYATRVVCQINLAAVQDVNNYWTINFRSINQAYTLATTLYSFATNGMATGSLVDKSGTPSTATDGTNKYYLDIYFLKVGAPGNITVAYWNVYFRYIIT